MEQVIKLETLFMETILQALIGGFQINPTLNKGRVHNKVCS